MDESKKGRVARIVVVGGLTRLEARYRDGPPEIDVETIDAGTGATLDSRLAAADGIVLVLAHVSHPAAAKVRSIARRRGTPLESTTGSSVSRVRAAIEAAFQAAAGRCAN